MKEQEIINFIKNKTENAQELFLQQYRPLIRYIVTPFLHNDQDIEECINDTVLKVCEKIDSFDSQKGSWNAWITTIARNTALNKARTYKSKDNTVISLESESLIDIPSSEPSPEEIIIRNEKQALVIKAIGNLSAQEKVIFYRRYYYQQSIMQIAAELGMTERSAEGKLYRIRKKLQDMIGGEFND